MQQRLHNGSGNGIRLYCPGIVEGESIGAATMPCAWDGGISVAKCPVANKGRDMKPCRSAREGGWSCGRGQEEGRGQVWRRSKVKAILAASGR